MVHDVLGQRVVDVDQPIVDYIVNVLADDDFDFGLDGEGAFEALGELLVAAGCVDDFSECRSVSRTPFPFFAKPKLVSTNLTILLLLFQSKCRCAARCATSSGSTVW